MFSDTYIFATKSPVKFEKKFTNSSKISQLFGQFPCNQSSAVHISSCFFDNFLRYQAPHRPKDIWNFLSFSRLLVFSTLSLRRDWCSKRLQIKILS